MSNAQAFANKTNNVVRWISEFFNAKNFLEDFGNRSKISRMVPLPQVEVRRLRIGGTPVTWVSYGVRT